MALINCISVKQSGKKADTFRIQKSILRQATAELRSIAVIQKGRMAYTGKVESSVMDDSLPLFSYQKKEVQK